MLGCPEGCPVGCLDGWPDGREDVGQGLGAGVGLLVGRKVGEFKLHAEVDVSTPKVKCESQAVLAAHTTESSKA